MPARYGPLDAAADRARRNLDELAREFRAARLDRGLSQSAVASAVGLSRTWVSRFEHAQLDPSVRQATLIAGAVGLDLGVRAFPTGHPIRDAAHVELLNRLRAILHRSLRLATEVPMPALGDMRAWDGMIRGLSQAIAVEAENRPRDLQALDRRIALKQRDANVDRVLLVLRDSRGNRALLRGAGGGLIERYPVPGRRAIELLRAGADPGGSAIVLL